MTSNIPSSSNDLNEASFAELALLLRASAGFAMRPRQMVVTPHGRAYARDLARRDPEFERRVRAEFPDLADSLLWPVQK